MTNSWNPERTWTTDEVRNVIRNQCPGVMAETAIPYGSGWDNAAFLIDSRWVFRFSQRQIAVPLLVREWNILPQLAPRLSVRIPHPTWFGYVDQWTFLGYERLVGRPASDLALDDCARVELAQSLGRFLRQLHEQPTGNLLIEPEALGRFDVARQRSRATQYLAECDSTIDVNSLQRILDDVDDTLGEVVLSHGDLYSRHLLVDQGLMSGVIDWGDVCLADAALDLMLAYCFLPPEARLLFFKAYGSFSHSTSSRARFRAVVHTLHVYRYAKSIGDEPLLREAITSLRFIINE